MKFIPQLELERLLLVGLGSTNIDGPVTYEVVVKIPVKAGFEATARLSDQPVVFVTASKQLVVISNTRNPNSNPDSTSASATMNSVIAYSDQPFVSDIGCSVQPSISDIGCSDLPSISGIGCSDQPSSYDNFEVAAMSVSDCHFEYFDPTETNLCAGECVVVMAAKLPTASLSQTADTCDIVVVVATEFPTASLQTAEIRDIAAVMAAFKAADDVVTNAAVDAISNVATDAAFKVANKAAFDAVNDAALMAPDEATTTVVVNATFEATDDAATNTAVDAVPNAAMSAAFKSEVLDTIMFISECPDGAAEKAVTNDAADPDDAAVQNTVVVMTVVKENISCGPQSIHANAMLLMSFNHHFNFRRLNAAMLGR